MTFIENKIGKFDEPVSAETLENDIQNLMVWCGKCHGERRHWLLHHFTTRWHDEVENGQFKISGSDDYQIVQCAGCEIVRFRHVQSFSEWECPEVLIFPKELAGEDSSIESFTDSHDSTLIPQDVLRLYRETLAAFNAGADTLCGGGLRAVVEMICQQQGITKGKLQDKIDELVTTGLLAKPQAELLHEERYLGNQALHEGVAPSRQNLRDGLKIVSWLVSTLYVIPNRAVRLREQRAVANV